MGVSSSEAEIKERRLLNKERKVATMMWGASKICSTNFERET